MGRKLSEETKRKISEIKKIDNAVKRPEVREKIRKAMIGNKNGRNTPSGNKSIHWKGGISRTWRENY